MPQFSCCNSEKRIKIGVHLPKLLQKQIRGPFFWNTLYDQPLHQHSLSVTLVSPTSVLDSSFLLFLFYFIPYLSHVSNSYVLYYTVFIDTIIINLFFTMTYIARHNTHRKTTVKGCQRSHKAQ